MNDQKILHLHLCGSMGNKTTLICRLKNGSIKYSLYGGTGSSGIPHSLRNIQYYEVINGNMRWLNGVSLPIENDESESLDQFKARVILMLNSSTHRVEKLVSTDVKFN